MNRQREWGYDIYRLPDDKKMATKDGMDSESLADYEAKWHKANLESRYPGAKFYHEAEWYYI